MTDGIIDSKISGDPFVRQAKEKYRDAVLNRDRRGVQAAIELIWQETRDLLGGGFDEDMAGMRVVLPDDLRGRARLPMDELKAIYEVLGRHLAARGVGGFSEFVTSNSTTTEDSILESTMAVLLE